MQKTILIAAALMLPLCAAGPAAAQDDQPVAAYLFADLSGGNEVPAGDADGYGDFAASFTVSKGEFCYELSVGDIGKVAAAHVHAGKAGENGDPVITISVTGAKNETCVAADEKLLKKIADNPQDYYVNVHTADHPAGAIRGQLQS